MIRSRQRFFTALAALAAMLFAHAAFALAACDLSSAQSRAHMVMQEGQHADCHQPADNANLCFAHCQGGEQTLDKHQVKVPEAPLHGIQVLHPWSVVLQSARHGARVPLPAAGPPPRILFRTLLI